MDKALAARSGLGWYGKNTNILTERFGSFVLLGEILTTLELEPDEPLRRDCGACRLCVVACPTGALGPDYSIDSRKCISYLTIEHRGPIPRELRSLMGAWVFGCDICQDVCPPTIEPYIADDRDRDAWTSSVKRFVARDAGEVGSGFGRLEPSSADDPLSSRSARRDVDLYWLLCLTQNQYVEAFRGSAMKRAKAWMLRRNAAVALGNTGDADAIDPLAQAMASDQEPIVRGHAAWALGHLGLRLRLDASAVLHRRERVENDESVLDEIRAAVRSISP
jgi:epoxyqueuosine reductase